MSLVSKFLLPLFLLAFFLAEAKPPDISPRDVKTKMDGILRAHAAHKKMTPDLLKRSMQIFIDEMDPMKTYFLASEIDQWINPSEELLKKTLEDFKHSNFQTFQNIHEQMVQAIHRRNQLEEAILKKPFPENVNAEEFKEPPFTTTIQELEERLLRLRSLQCKAMESTEEAKQESLKRLQKRRTNRENEILGEHTEDKQKTLLAFVLKAMAASLDNHTTYFTPSEASQFMIQVQQRLFGIGAQLKDNLNGFSIVRILEGGPASLSNKLKINDRIIAVDHQPVVGMDITEAVELIRGEKGTTVNLTILRDSEDKKTSEKFNLELVRGEVVLEESRLETQLEPFADGVILHLKLFSFYQDLNSSSGQDIAKAIENVKKEHRLKAVVLDLRSNAGGLLPQAVSVTGLFITKGVVVSIKDESGKVQHLREMDDKITWDGPLFVFTNKASASAAEIVAQTLQDYGRAIVIGDDHTFGKGTFQTFTLEAENNGKVNPQGEFKVTRGKYYTVSGQSPQLKGVKADIVVPGILSELDIGEEFSKYPLENDSISPHFEDDLSDIPLLHRETLGRLYRKNLQPRLTSYQPFLEILKKNSEERIKNNKNYQNFLTEIRKKNFTSPSVELFEQTDMQYQASLNIVKDFLYLSQMTEKPFE